MYDVVQVESKSDLQDFIQLPFTLYRGDPNFVPPLRSRVKSALEADNSLFARGPHALFLCRKNKQLVARIMIGIDRQYNDYNGYESAWFSLFDCIQDIEAARALLTEGELWAKANGAAYLRGPESPDNTDTYKGILVFGFNGPPALMNSYNPPWYQTFFDQLGFTKMNDLYAYRFDVERLVTPKKTQIVQYAMKRYNYRVDSLDKTHLDRDLDDIHAILVQTVPTFRDEHMSIPSREDVQQIGQSMLSIADPDLVCIARTNDTNLPIGYVAALPDYNQVMQKVKNGKLFPTGFIKMLYYRRKITSARVLMQFVIPEYQGRAVNNAIFYEMCRKALAKGIISGDGSTIGENNRQSRLSVEKLGAEHYRTYRIYKKKIQ